MLGDTFGGAYPSWTVGVTVGYPIGQTGAEAAVAQSQLQKRQQELEPAASSSCRSSAQVRDAARQVQTAYQRVQAHAGRARRRPNSSSTPKSGEFAVGLSTTLDVQQRQRDLASARLNELSATIAYNRALINFERVQKMPVVRRYDRTQVRRVQERSSAGQLLHLTKLTRARSFRGPVVPTYLVPSHDSS